MLFHPILNHVYGLPISNQAAMQSSLSSSPKIILIDRFYSNLGCLPFKKIPVSSVGKFRTRRIVYNLHKIPIMDNMFHFFTKSASVAPGREDYLELVWKARNVYKWNKEIHSERSNRENRTTFSDDPYISWVFQLDEPKKRFPFTFQPKFPEFSSKW